MTDKEREAILRNKVARMATVDSKGSPLVVPVCYGFDGKYIFTPLDKKPKLVSVYKLKRVRNILDNPQVSLVIDRYDDNWEKLYYLIIQGSADILENGLVYKESLKILCEKYPQYKKMNLTDANLPVIRIKPQRIISWGDI